VRLEGACSKQQPHLWYAPSRSCQSEMVAEFGHLQQRAAVCICRQCRWRGGIDQHMCTFMWLLVVHSCRELHSQRHSQPPHLILKLNGGGATVLRQGRRMRVTCAWADRGCPGGSPWPWARWLCTHIRVFAHLLVQASRVHSALVRLRWLCTHIRVFAHLLVRALRGHGARALLH